MNVYKPKCEELEYRMNLLCNPDTMSYNKGYKLGIPEYDNDTGCIDFPKEKWEKWYADWVLNEPMRFYSYLSVNNEFVGEIALRYVESEDAHMINIIIDSRYRGMGYGREGLLLLMKIAFQDFGLDKIIDDIPITREPSKRLFEKLGFRYEIEDELIKFSMTKDEYESLKPSLI